MTKRLDFSPWRVLLPVGLGTALSLMGDTALYAVLPTNMAEAGVTVATIGILLSANRFIRLIFNGPIGLIYDRYPRRNLFVGALFVGALSTAIYAFTVGFWPLLVGRLLWGLAWSGIWVGGNTIILDISRDHNRGRWVGIYQVSFFLGASGGALLGGLLTDQFGYHQAMAVGAVLTLIGAIVALLLLPETRGLRLGAGQSESTVAKSETSRPHKRAEMISAVALMGVNRLVLAGILMPTLGLFLFEQIGNSINIGSLSIGVATLTGIALSATGLISMASVSISGTLSDRAGNRWQAVAGGLIPGIAGFGILALAAPFMALVAIPLTAISGGSNQGLSTSLVGDLSPAERRGRSMGILFTVGDLTSAIGPPLAYSLIPWIGLSVIYLLNAGIVLLMFFVALWWAFLPRSSKDLSPWLGGKHQTNDEQQPDVPVA